MNEIFPTGGTTVDNQTKVVEPKHFHVTVDKDLARWQDMVNKGQMTEYEQAVLIAEYLAKRGIYM